MNDIGAGAAPCAFCGHSMGYVGTKRGQKIWWCQRCMYGAVVPQPTQAELGFLYSMSSGYFAVADRNLAQSCARSSNKLNDRLIGMGVGPSKLLDVGCATGKLIFHLKAQGWKVYGCDLNAEAIEIAKENGLDHVICGELEDVLETHVIFDAINMGDLIEHVLNPRATLETAYSLLKPGGVLCIRAPNAESTFARSTRWLAKAVGLPWLHSEAPYHLHEFSPHSINLLLQKVGFDVVNLETSGHGSFAYIVGGSGYFDTLKDQMKESGQYKFSWSLLPYIPRLILIAGLTLPFWLYSRFRYKTAHSGVTMNIVAKRNYL